MRKENFVTGMTPNEAEKKQNHPEVLANLYLKAKRDRKYPALFVGDTVKVYRKRKKGEKEITSVWSENNYTIESIEKFQGQNFYNLFQGVRPYSRHELLKVQ